MSAGLAYGTTYRHEALLYAGDRGFVEGVLPFIHAAVEADEPVLVLVRAQRIALLREALDDVAEDALFADMGDVGTNPARLIPAWQRFIAAHAGRRVRGVGEPIWPGRSPAELAECHRHEALLNVAFGDPDLWLLCPYDVAALPDAVIDEARRNHPYLRHRDATTDSDRFPGSTALAAPCEEPLHDPPASALTVPVDRASLPRLRHFVARMAAQLELPPAAVRDVVLAVNELTTNTVRHAGGAGTLRLWPERDALVCEVEDRGTLRDPLAGRRRPGHHHADSRGLWLANQLCELVQIRSFPDRTVVRVHKRW